MKFSTNQLIAILALLVAGVILAHVFAPAAAATVVSIATTVIGTLFLQKRDGGDPPAGGGTGAPDLKVISGGLGAFVIGSAIALASQGCGATFAEIEDAANTGDVSSKLAQCRGEARAAFYVAQKTEAEALAAYDDCKKREGL